MKKLLHVFIVSFLTSIIVGQGLTTSGVNGYVKSSDGEGLVGANVMMTHTPTGTQYGTTSMDNGQFSIINMKIGGPYEIAVSYIGYGDQTQSDVYLNLGQDARVDFSLSAEALEMSGVEVVAEGEEEPTPPPGQDPLKLTPTICRLLYLN